jgi:hypothetical protein
MNWTMQDTKLGAEAQAGQERCREGGRALGDTDRIVKTTISISLPRVTIKD